MNSAKEGNYIIAHCGGYCITNSKCQSKLLADCNFPLNGVEQVTKSIHYFTLKCPLLTNTTPRTKETDPDLMDNLHR